MVVSVSESFNKGLEDFFFFVVGHPILDMQSLRKGDDSAFYRVGLFPDDQETWALNILLFKHVQGKRDLMSICL